MYNFLEHSENYSMTVGCFWSYYWDKIDDDKNENENDN